MPYALAGGGAEPGALRARRRGRALPDGGARLRARTTYHPRRRSPRGSATCSPCRASTARPRAASSEARALVTDRLRGGRARRQARRPRVQAGRHPHGEGATSRGRWPVWGGASRAAACCPSCRWSWELLVQAVHTRRPALFVGRRDAGRARGRLPRHAAVQPARLPLLVPQRQGVLRLGAPARAEPGRALPAVGRARAGLLRARAGHDDAAVVRPRHPLRRSARWRSAATSATSGARGRASRFIGVVLYAASRLRDARAGLQEAIRLLRQTGDQWEVNTAGWNVALCHWRTRRTRPRRRDGPRGCSLGAARSVTRPRPASALGIWTRAATGRSTLQLINEQLANGGDDAQTAAELQLGAALYRRADGDLAGALPSIGRGRRPRCATPACARSTSRPSSRGPPRSTREVAEADLGATTRARRRTAARRGPRRAPGPAVGGRVPQQRTARAARSQRCGRACGGAPRAAACWPGASPWPRRRARATRRRSRTPARAELLLAMGRPRTGSSRKRGRSRPQPICADRAGAERRENWRQVPTLSMFDRFATLLNVGRAITAAASYPALEDADPRRGAAPCSAPSAATWSLSRRSSQERLTTTVR